MKNSYKAVLLSVLGLSVASAAHAGNQSDLMLGLTDWSASTPTDYILDIGAQTGFTTTTTGSGSLSGLGTTFSSLDSSYVNDQTIAGTVVGAQATGNYPANLYATVDPANYSAPNTMTVTKFQTAVGQPGAIGGVTFNPTPGQSVTAVSTTQNGISYYTYNAFDDATSVNGNTHAVGNQVGQSIYAVADSSGIITEDLYLESQPASGATPNPWQELGVFTIDLNQDTWTYDGVAAVPEPTTYGLLAGFGLLVLTFRRQFIKKNA